MFKIYITYLYNFCLTVSYIYDEYFIFYIYQYIKYISRFPHEVVK